MQAVCLCEGDNKGLDEKRHSTSLILLSAVSLTAARLEIMNGVETRSK